MSQEQRVRIMGRGVTEGTVIWAEMQTVILWLAVESEILICFVTMMCCVATCDESVRIDVRQQHVTKRKRAQSVLASLGAEVEVEEMWDLQSDGGGSNAAVAGDDANSYLLHSCRHLRFLCLNADVDNPRTAVVDDGNDDRKDDRMMWNS